MSYDAREEARMALLMGMITGSGSKGLDIVQNHEQQRAIAEHLLPYEMHPNSKSFEAVGFIFEEIPGDSVLCHATLPAGWRTEFDGVHWTELLDEKGRKRGSSFYKSAFWDRNGHMSLDCRFSIGDERSDETGITTIFIRDYQGDNIYTIGSTTSRRDDKEYKKLKKRAEGYMKEHYPDWKNPVAYWDD